MIMTSISATAISRPLIQCYGISGHFATGGSGNSSHRVTVKYFNTVASQSSDSPAGNSLDLLRQLKPLRERVQADQIRDLKSLLQRELNDYRVAHELVPYLQGVSSDVGFFPAILVALIPKGFLGNAQSAPLYPTPKTEGNITKYADRWSLETFEVGGSMTALGRIAIDPESTELIVLDGQHRANAFRYVTGTFDQATGDTIYSAFYETLTLPETFPAELPVTIVWFEASQNISPTLISRRLFVDVNTNAKLVSESRNILLNDSHLPSMATANLYSEIAAVAGFSAGELSLLHCAFDSDDRFPKTSLLQPTVINHMMSFLLYSPGKYDDVAVDIHRTSESRFDYSPRVNNYIPSLSKATVDDAKRGQPPAIETIDKLLAAHVCPIVLTVLRRFVLFSKHYETCARLESSLLSGSAGGGGFHRETWQKVYKGGEGLYDAFEELRDKGSKNKYIEAIDYIDQCFLKIRCEVFDGVDPSEVSRAFATLGSKAGITGLFMSLAYVAHDRGWSAETADLFVDSLNQLSPDAWLHVLGEFKSGIVKELNPRLWPDIRALFLRVLQDREVVSVFPDSCPLVPRTPEEKRWHKLFITCPDVRLARKLVKGMYQRWFEEQFEESPELAQETYDEWIEKALDSVEDTLKKCCLKPFLKKKKLREHLRCFVESFLELSDQDDVGSQSDNSDDE